MQVATERGEVSLYNFLYRSFFGLDSNFQQILDREALRVFRDGILTLRRDPVRGWLHGCSAMGGCMVWVVVQTTMLQVRVTEKSTRAVTQHGTSTHQSPYSA